ncbi:MAG: SUMF1/EgtB/PvdO family nonheme iron enzyme [Armatimonadota bacterium]
MRPISLMLTGVLLLALGMPSFARAVDIHTAAAENDLASVRELLKADPTLLNAPDAEGRTLLIVAAAWGHQPIVTFLLDSGAEVNRVDNNNCSALHWAAWQGHRAVVQMLLDRNIDVTLKDKKGRTAQQFAEQQKQAEIAKLIADYGKRTTTPTPAPAPAAVNIPRGLLKAKEKAALGLLGVAQTVTLSWGAVELTPEILAAGTPEALAGDCRRVQAVGLPTGLVELALRKAGTPGIRAVQVAVTATRKPTEITAVLGEPASREKDAYRDPAQPNAPARPMTWLKYGWLHFGVVEDRVLLARADCPLLEAARMELLPKPGQVIVNGKDKAEAVYVPAGSYTMGYDRGDGDERPPHRVNIDGFWIYKREVTVGQYRLFCKETGRTMYPLPAWAADNYPVTNVTWDDAVAYAAWAGGRLPTEAEWEKAARGTDGRKFTWGNELDVKKLNCKDSGHKRTVPVGSYPAGAGPYGTLDMAGNVYEWCQDWFDVNYYRRSPVNNPQGPATAPDRKANYDIGPSRIIRGGSYESDGVKSYCANRKGSNPTERADDRGFRIVFLPPEPAE